MSRGNKEAASGILSHSMRNNYNQHGVDEYYKKVGATYRNPHFPGVRQCLFLWLNRWWEHERERFSSTPFTIFDMACGSGEVTVSFIEWWSLGKAAYASAQSSGVISEVADLPSSRKRSALSVPEISSSYPTPQILAADPYTAEAFETRTKLRCASLSFRDIAEGALPPRKQFDKTISEGSAEPVTSEKADDSASAEVEIVFCSFALHLFDNPSELFALLWELSTKSRWLVVLAPHKKPEIKDGWGWMKWDIDAWSECPMTQSTGELLQDRVHCRVYRSLSCS